MDFLAHIPVEMLLAFLIGLLVFGPEKTIQFAVDGARWLRTARKWTTDIQKTLTEALSDIIQEKPVPISRRQWIPPVPVDSGVRLEKEPAQAKTPSKEA